MDEEAPRATPAGFSNYPRAASASDVRPPGVYVDWIGKGFRLAFSKLFVWVSAIVVASASMVAAWMAFAAAYSVLLYGLLDIWVSVSLAADVFLAASGVLLAYLFLASGLYMGVKQARGQPIRCRDIFIGLRFAVPLTVTFVLTTLLVSCGLLLLVGPGLYLLSATTFAPILVIDRKMKPVQAMQASIVSLKNHIWPMLGLLTLSATIGSLGYCAILIGLGITVPASFVTMGLTYNSFFADPKPVTAEPQPIGLEPPR